MTAVALSVQPDKIVLGADALLFDHARGDLVRDPDGRPALMTKTIVVPHARLMASSLGALDLSHLLAQLMPQLPDFDAALERLPGLLRAGGERIGLGRMSPGARPRLGDVALVCGWSEARGQMVGAAFASKTGFDDCDTTLVGDSLQRPEQEGCTVSAGWFHPGPTPPIGMAWPDSPTTMFAVLRWQIEQWRKDDPTVPAGGPCTVAVLERDRVELTVAGDLGMPTDAPALLVEPTKPVDSIESRGRGAATPPRPR